MKKITFDEHKKNWTECKSDDDKWKYLQKNKKYFIIKLDGDIFYTQYIGIENYIFTFQYNILNNFTFLKLMKYFDFNVDKQQYIKLKIESNRI